VQPIEFIGVEEAVGVDVLHRRFGVAGVPSSETIPAMESAKPS
jgi:hypothetical protein